MKEGVHNKHKTKFYRLTPYVLFVPNQETLERVKNSKTFNRELKRIFKLGMVGTIAFGTHSLIDLMTSNINNLQTGFQHYDLISIFIILRLGSWIVLRGGNN